MEKCALVDRLVAIPRNFIFNIPNFLLGLGIYGVYQKIRYIKYKRIVENICFGISKIKQEYDRQLYHHRDEFLRSVKDKWDIFGTPYLEIPENGIDYTNCLNLIIKYANITQQNLKHKQLSGTIYVDKLTEMDETPNLNLPPSLETLYIEIFRRSYLWNSLHDEEFPIASFLNYQVIQMVSQLYGAKSNQIMGLVTTGGTQSLMNAVRSYINFGIYEKGLDIKDITIIAPDTIHAAVFKAQSAYHFNLVLLKTDEYGMINVNDLESQVYKYNKQLVALFCSAPSYPYGTLDDISLFAKLAKQYQVGLHVDCCLGGFIGNFIKDCMPVPILSINGVTSLSVDTHKNGLAPKGSSVLIYQKLRSHNVMYYSIYTLTNWKGGIYGTPKDEGSCSCVELFLAYITLLYNGRNTYHKIAHMVYDATQKLSAAISRYNQIQILNSSHSPNIVAFRFKGSSPMNQPSYRLSDILKEKGYILNTMPNNTVHLCVTLRFINSPDSMSKFQEIFNDAYLQVIEELNQGQTFTGTNKLYCSVHNINQPSLTNLSIGKYLENCIFGQRGISDAIRMHFLTLNNPDYDYT